MVIPETNLRIRLKSSNYFKFNDSTECWNVDNIFLMKGNSVSRLNTSNQNIAINQIFYFTNFFIVNLRSNLHLVRWA